MHCWDIAIRACVEEVRDDLGIVANRSDMQGGELACGAVKSFHQVWVSIDQNLNSIGGTTPASNVQTSRSAVGIKEIHNILD